jgi:hypoxanthine phosphoribosyltransferase
VVETVTPPIQLFDERRIANRVREIAGEIAGTVGGEFTVVGLLKGSFVFVADLARALDRHGLAPRVEFMRLSSYGSEKISSGEVRLIGAPPADIAGRRVVVVDDIVDTGRSPAFAAKLVAEHDAARVWTCALLDYCSIVVDFHRPGRSNLDGLPRQPRRRDASRDFSPIIPDQGSTRRSWRHEDPLSKHLGS